MPDSPDMSSAVRNLTKDNAYMHHLESALDRTIQYFWSISCCMLSQRLNLVMNDDKNLTFDTMLIDVDYH